MVQVLVLADDRTGALEVAGELADALGPVPVVAYDRPLPPAGAVVVDLASRHLGASAAAGRAVAASVPAARRLHKIDSTLRGRWADELVAVQRITGQRVLVVAALPRLGRTCVDGVVHVDGAPLRLTDARLGSVEARPAAVLGAAGADVVEVVDVAEWLADESAPPFAVCDAATDADLRAIGAQWRTAPGVILAGTSASLAAGIGDWHGGREMSRREEHPAPTRSAPEWGGRETSRWAGDSAPTWPLARPALVVIGSLHPTATAQLDALRAAALDGVEVLATERAVGAVTDEDAERVAAALAAEVVGRLDRLATLLIVGGDTTAAVLGDGVVVAGGTVAAGIPWARRAGGGGPLVVTKAGGFGGPQALVELLIDEGR